MGSLCVYCINNQCCDKSDGSCKDNFIPHENVKSYFKEGCCNNSKTWYYDPTNEYLSPTHSIRINYKYYCPYCGNEMFIILDSYTLNERGHCCMCEGAISELAYSAELEILEKRQHEKLLNLQRKYRESLIFHIDKLLENKQKEEYNSFKSSSRKYNHFSTMNGKPYEDIKQIFESTGANHE